MDDFLLRALIGGIALAAITGPLGAIVVWRRMAYFGDSLAHSALLGVVLGILLGLPIELGILVVCLVVAFLLAWLQKQPQLSSDTLLGIMAHGTLSIGLVVASAHLGRIDLMAYLFGDILSIGKEDIILIFMVTIIGLGMLRVIWKPLMRTIVHESIARVEGTHVDVIRLCVMLLIALVVAVSIKVVGLLLITSLLIIPAAAARYIARIPSHMAISASLIGMMSVALGLYSSFHYDTPSGPSIVVASLVLLLIIIGLGKLGAALKH